MAPGDEVPDLRLAFGHVPDDDFEDGIPNPRTVLQQSADEQRGAGLSGLLLIERRGVRLA